MNNDPIRLGILGLGRAFTLMLPTFANDKRIQLVAAFDELIVGEIAHTSQITPAAQGNLLKNRTLRAITQLGYNTEQVRIIDWENEIENNKRAEPIMNEIDSLMKKKEPFMIDMEKLDLKVMDKEVVDSQVGLMI